MEKERLQTFQLVKNDEVISPALTTIRQYGYWFEKTFDKYTAEMELYMKSKKKTGESLLEWHPGSRIGAWFDSNQIDSPNLKCWFIMQDSYMMERLVKLKLAEQKDAIPIAVNDEKGRRMLRVYTVEQIQLYIKSIIDKNFNIADYVGTPKQVKIKDSDFGNLIKPKMNIQRQRKLF